MSTGRNYAKESRERARKKGGVIVYGMITDPAAIKAWKKLQEIFGNNRDAIENAIIDCYEQLENHDQENV